MARDDKRSPRDADGELGDFVPAVFARSIEEAEEYRQLLDDHDIPAIVGGDDRPAGATGQPPQPKVFSRGVPVLVPEAMLDEAGEVIAERDETDTFGLQEEEEEDEEDEIFALDGSEPEEVQGDLDEEDEEEEKDKKDKKDEDEDEDLEGENLFEEDDEDDEDDKGDKDP
ncbi:MAG: hypothetical protein MUP47_03130 [Phycisphaerae bacterium]|nr:hypothetical protein [Phycisphaerae bacterium]